MQFDNVFAPRPCMQSVDILGDEQKFFAAPFEFLFQPCKGHVCSVWLALADQFSPVMVEFPD